MHRYFDNNNNKLNLWVIFMRKLKLERRPVEKNNINSINEKNQEFNNTNYQQNNERSNNKAISVDDYIKKSQIDHFTLLKIIFFVLFIGVGIFAIYHIFYGANGIVTQRNKAYELNELEYLKKIKLRELEQKSQKLKALYQNDIDEIEIEARKKGYIYPEEKIIKVINDKEMKNTEEEPVNNKKKTDHTSYLIFSIIATILIIITSYFINLRKKK